MSRPSRGSDRNPRQGIPGGDSSQTMSEVAFLQAQLEDAQRIKQELIDKYERNMEDLREYYETEIQQMNATKGNQSFSSRDTHGYGSPGFDRTRGDSQQMAALEEALRNSEDTVAQLRRQLEEHRRITAKLQEKIDRDQASFSDRTPGHDESSAILRRKEDEWKSTVHKLKQEKSQVERKLASALEELDVLSKQAEGMGGNMNRVLDKVSDLEHQLRNKMDEVEELQRLLDAKENEMVDVQINLDDAVKDLDHYKSENEYLRQQMEQLTRNREEQSSSLNKITAEFQTLQKQNSEFLSKHGDIADRISEQQNQIESLKQELSDCRGKLKDTSSERDRLSYELALCKKRIETLQNDQSQQQDVIAHLRKEVQPFSKVPSIEIPKEQYDSGRQQPSLGLTPKQSYDTPQEEFRNEWRENKSMHTNPHLASPTSPSQLSNSGTFGKIPTQAWAPHVPQPSSARGLESSFDPFTGETIQSRNRTRRSDFARSKPFARDDRSVTPSQEPTRAHNTPQTQYRPPMQTDSYYDRQPSEASKKELSTRDSPAQYSRSIGRAELTVSDAAPLSRRNSYAFESAPNPDPDRWKIPTDIGARPVIQQPAAPPPNRSAPSQVPWGTDISLQSRMATTSELEKKLMDLSIQKSKFESELNHVNRTPMKPLQRRRAKEELEEKLTKTDHDIQQIRKQLRQMNAL